MVQYSERELEVVGEHISTTSFGSFVFKTPKYNTPITPKENVALCVKRETPYWFPSTMDFCNLESRTNIDHVARAEVMDMGPPYKDEEKGGKDLFGIPWVYVPTAGGSMVQPGNPTLLDANDWPEIIHFPDIDALDWEECKKLNSCLNESTRSFHVTFQNGIFERLISFMDFEGAAMAIIDEEQQDAVHALFDKLADMYISMIDHYLEFLKLDGVVFHDDWGSQRAPFFSLDVCMEMVAPYLKKVADHCHARGLWFQQHCCGKNELLVPAMIYAGVDMWQPQVMNDVVMLREKYGDKIMFSMAPPSTPREATDAEIEAAADAFVSRYAADFREKPFLVGSFFADPRFTKAIYKYSRLALS
ncbi:MAG: methyltransferase [Oscillospiraceae bacterium]|nr:methyltransferase [Oscillospiraceae bacterium]